MNTKIIFSFLDRYRISALGFCIGFLFFAASMTPSLIPRTAVIQGTLGGAVMAIGYLFAIVLIVTWRFLQLPEITNALRRLVVGFVFIVSFAISLAALYNLRGSQNELRALMTMKPLGASHEIVVVAVVFSKSSRVFIRRLPVLVRGHDTTPPSIWVM